MEHQASEDGEQMLQLLDYILTDHSFFSSTDSFSASNSTPSSEGFPFANDSSPSTSFNSTWSSVDNGSNNRDDTESSCSSDTFNSVEFNDRRRKANEWETVHYSILEGTYLASLELAKSRLLLSDSRRELLVDSAENEDEGVHSKSAEAVRLPSASENEMATPKTFSHECRLDYPQLSKGGLRHTDLGQDTEHGDQVDISLGVAHTHGSTDAASMLSTGSGIAGQAPSELLEHDKLTKNEKKEGLKQGESAPVLRSESDCLVQINEYFEIRNTSLGGSGSFSRKDLKRGDVILRENFIIRTNSYTLDEQFESLDFVGRRAYLCLHPHWPLNQEKTDVMSAICHTNAFNIGGGSAVFPIAARFNHKCSSMSNIDFNYDRRAGLMVFTVKAEEVAAGEELTLSYGGNPRSLHERYGFFCQCGGCEGWSQEQADELQKLNWCY
ncbi:hypothetical protein PpBr36_08480 [Pyricularia pennisetigena]|uniref:hypothetical protein n=1 Tax=Pyricularia pennisetigena TaxID=1578925 RepID=UPI00114D94EF|nr:hypothetical protein PpBr36_08480 [Pyricularia pennisetigena]TLS24221.1 hypothetical protein PpBr36_08480 [Pyricularia pennisetigena]